MYLVGLTAVAAVATNEPLFVSRKLQHYQLFVREFSTIKSGVFV